MEPKGFHRKLTAILCADVAGYSRLMQDDESAILRKIKNGCDMPSSESGVFLLAQRCWKQDAVRSSGSD